MTSSVEEMLSPVPAPDTGDRPRQLVHSLTGGDRVFTGIVRSAGALVLIVTGAIGLFLGYQAIPTLRRYGVGFLSQTEFNPELNRVGISSGIVGTIEVAVIALVIAFPLAILTALYISQYAPVRLKSVLTSRR